MPADLNALRQVIAQHWGYHDLRPHQEPAMMAVLQGRDSLVVMPTGGGKSLCYQAPAVARGGLTVVVSPLIALMKDQVDGLRACGVRAAQIDSSLSPDKRAVNEKGLAGGAITLLFIAPERLALTDFCNLLRRAKVHTFAIDEAHCISHWGHDFRPDYRQLGRLKELFPGVSVHGYTATATERVRQDVSAQLRQTDPLLLVGNFDRPNLTYRICPRLDQNGQILAVLARHRGEAGIVYCPRRKDVDEINAFLNAKGIKSLPYHAGLTPDQRAVAQEAFTQEQCDLIVATIAFGMGIDRSNVRFILHTGMPKSIEHYQQETGRAGRDGLEAECVLLHSPEDLRFWKWLLSKSSAEGKELDPDFLAGALAHLNDIDRFCRGGQCRHRGLVEYFGQRYHPTNCAACDICLGDRDPVPDAVVIAQKILSCVYRVDQRFGVNHVISVLRGENLEKIRSLNHHQLSTFGLLKNHDKNELRDWIYQLIGQKALVQEGTDYPVLKLNEASWQVMSKEIPVRLMRSTEGKETKAHGETESWEGVDRNLFEELRAFRRELAQERNVPPYLIFGDKTLRELARYRPTTEGLLKMIYGIGDRKRLDFGQQVLVLIRDHCRARGLDIDLPFQNARPKTSPGSPSPATGLKQLAFELFHEGASAEEVVRRTGRARSTVMHYLAEYILREKPPEVGCWVAPEVYARVARVVQKIGAAPLKPIFESLEQKISYDDIRVVVSHLTSRGLAN